MKKSVLILLSLLIVLTTVLFTSQTASAETYSGSCGDSTYWNYDSTTKTLTISGTGTMKNYSSSKLGYTGKSITTAPWRTYYNQIEEVVVENGVTNIGQFAFTNCNKIKTAYIADTVENIGYEAFSYCSSLNQIELSKNLKVIGSCAFWGCNNLREIRLPNTVTDIYSGAFGNCYYLESVYYCGTSEEKNLINIGENPYLTDANWIYREILETGTCGDNLVWTLDSHNVITISGNGDMYDYINNNPWYSKRDEEISVVINDGVTSIGAYAFYNCYGFKNISIPNSVTSIGASAFRSSGFTKINIPNSFVSIGANAFKGCGAEFNIPKNITCISDYAFAGCGGLKNVTIPDSVTVIGQGAFENSDIESITMGNNVTKIYFAAFSGCTELETVNIGENVEEIGSEAFSNCSKLKKIIIPDSVTYLGSKAFYQCSNLLNATIGNSVLEIGDSTFCGCTNLASITLGKNITEIGKYAFRDCRGIARTVILNDKLTTIKEQAFAGCVGLASITIPDSVGFIGVSAFHGCVGLSDVSIGNGVKWVGVNAFAQCSGIKTNRYDSSKYIGNPDNPYYYLISGSGLTTTIHPDTRIIGYGAFSEPRPDDYHIFDDLKTIFIPYDVVSIGDCAFMDCRNLTTITIGNRLRLIGTGAFYGTNLSCGYYIGTKEQYSKLASNINSLEIDVGKWPSFCYYDCVTSGHIFENDTDNFCYVCKFDKSLCNHIYDNTCDNSCNVCGFMRTTLGHIYTSDCDEICNCCNNKRETVGHTYDDLYDKYCNLCYELRPQPTGVTGDCTWTLDGTELTISGNGAMENYNSRDEVPWFVSTVHTITSVVIEDGVTNVGDYAFYDCFDLFEVLLGKDIKKIGDEAFAQCYSITSITIPNSVTSIGRGAFSGCNSLTSIEIPSSVTNIGNFVFSSCSSLCEIKVSNDNNSYSSENGVLFDKDRKLLICYSQGKTGSYYKIPVSVTSIECGAFADCSSLTNIEIPKSVTTLGEDAFVRCSADLILKIDEENTMAINYAITNNIKYEIIINWGKFETIANAIKNTVLKMVKTRTDIVYVKAPTPRENAPLIADVLASSFGESKVVIIDENGIIGTGDKISIDGVESDIVIKGDIDGDGIVTVFDALMVKKALANNGFENEALREFAADVDGATGTTEADVDAILSYIVGKGFINNSENIELAACYSGNSISDTSLSVITLTYLNENKYDVAIRSYTSQFTGEAREPIVVNGITYSYLGGGGTPDVEYTINNDNTITFTIPDFSTATYELQQNNLHRISYDGNVFFPEVFEVA